MGTTFSSIQDEFNLFIDNTFNLFLYPKSKHPSGLLVFRSSQEHFASDECWLSAGCPNVRARVLLLIYSTRIVHEPTL